MGFEQLPGGSELVPAERANLGSALPEPSPAVYSTGGETVSLGDYWRILRKRKWVVVTTLLIVMICTALITMRMTPIYQATARINITRPTNDLIGKDSAAVTDDDYTVSIETQVRILQSDSLALSVVKRLGLDKPTGATPAGSAPAAVPQLDPQREAALISDFQSRLKVVPVPNTRVLSVTYSSADPRQAADAVNTLVNNYIEQNIKTHFESTMQAAEWLSKQLADLQIRVETSQAKLVEYEKEHQIIGGDEKRNIITDKLEDVSKELNAAEADRIQKEALYQFAASGAAEKASMGHSEILHNLRSQEADLKQQIAQASIQYGPSYPRLVELKARLQEVQQNIQTESQKMVVSLQNDYLAAGRREKLLRTELEKQKAEANQLNQSAIEYSLLKREADSNRQLYEDLLRKLKEAGLSAGLNSSNVRVVDSARVPIAPSYPNIPRNMQLGFLLGLCGGMALAFVMEALDNTVSLPEHVEAYAGLPSLGMIPMSSTLKGSAAGRTLLKLKPAPEAKTSAIELVAHCRPNSELAEAYRALRTSILLSSPGSPPKILLVTSALPQEGKTTTSINCAIVLAQQGRRVLLVDADLRRPTIHRSFGLRPRAGLSDVLAGREQQELVTLASPHLPNLFILPAGAQPPHPAELLSSPVMKKLIEQWRGQYDHVVIDSPPALTVTDAVLLSVDVDRVIVVVRSGQTSKAAMRRARDLLLQVNAKVMGVVINAVDLTAPDHYYYYYSGSKYYGSYYHE